MQQLVDGVTRERDADLVLARREAPLDEAEVARAAADVDEERIDDRVEVVWLREPRVVAVAERGEERLGRPDQGSGFKVFNHHDAEPWDPKWGNGLKNLRPDPFRKGVG